MNEIIWSSIWFNMILMWLDFSFIARAKNADFIEWRLEQIDVITKLSNELQYVLLTQIF